MQFLQGHTVAYRVLGKYPPAPKIGKDITGTTALEMNKKMPCVSIRQVVDSGNGLLVDIIPYQEGDRDNIITFLEAVVLRSDGSLVITSLSEIQVL